MKIINSINRLKLIIGCFFLSTTGAMAQQQPALVLNDSGYFESRGVNVLAFSNWYNGLFSDSKMSGIEIIHHGVRTATNGDVRLNPTPEQWDPIPQFVKRSVDRKKNSITAELTYPKYNFTYAIVVQPESGGLKISLQLDQPLPKSLENKAGFNLEFLPTAYFGKGYLMDTTSGLFPSYPSSDMHITKWNTVEPLPFASGNQLVLAPEDSERRVTIRSSTDLMLYDGRNKAQNGWFVVRSLIPSGKSGTVLEWYLEPNSSPDWVRSPIITHSQVGYHPNQQKVAIIELDKYDTNVEQATLYKIEADGSMTKKTSAMPSRWGTYLRYNYLTFDFSDTKEPGLYMIRYGDQKTNAFRIAPDVYTSTWTPTLDVFFPVQMDHMFVNEAYRVWHGASHLDDALQAPVNHEHFDLYGQGPTTDTPYKPGEHIPGLNIGGWYDAGDFDIRTQTQYATVMYMVQTWEEFGIQRDETTINQQLRYVDMHVPDGKADLLQQIEHGTLALIAQHRALGRAIPGIVEAHLSQYTHLGDGVNKTDNYIYSSELDSLEKQGERSGTFDDRWAFTSKTTPLNYGSIAALAAASRALRGYNDSLADECINTAIKVWEEEHSHAPYIFYVGNTTGGPLEHEELKAAVELLITTGNKKYATRISELWPVIDSAFNQTAFFVARSLPHMSDRSFERKFKNRVAAYAKDLSDLEKENPFGVRITTGGWAGNGTIIHQAVTNYFLHKLYPEIIKPEHVLQGLNYIYGTHPGSNISFVSGVGSESSTIAYGNNRADFSYIAGGVVPGVLVLPPDYPENKQDWPFLWGENEYVINVGASYILLVNAAHKLLN